MNLEREVFIGMALISEYFNTNTILFHHYLTALRRLKLDITWYKKIGKRTKTKMRIRDEMNKIILLEML